jgi:choline dehydrogenase-like flavoprotein
MAPDRVVVVGTGAAGGWVIRRLTERGVPVLAIDAGPEVAPRPELFRPNPGTNRLDRPRGILERRPVQSSHPFFADDLADLYVDDRDNPYSSPDDAPYLWLRSRAVGGRSLLWGGVSLRLTELELEDWPLGAADLAPYYDQVERALGVCGGPLTPAELHLKEKIESRWPQRRIIPTPGISRVEPSAADPRWPRGTSQGFGLIDAARSGRLELRPHTIAERIGLDRAERAAALSVIDAQSGVREEIEARAIVLCASAIETARLLLLSAEARHPGGLGGQGGWLGRGLMDHPGFGLLGVVPGAAPTAIPSDYARGICLPRFGNLGARTERYARGYGAIGFAGRALDSYTLPDRVRGQAVFGLWVLADMLPSRDNGVTLRADRSDRWGVPAIHAECRLSDNERIMLEDARRDLLEMLAAAGCEVLDEESQLPGLNIHETGTARMGADPKASVVDREHRVWGVPNLFVADGALFPSIGWQNPTLTIMALAARCGDRVAAAWAQGEL